MNKKFLVGITTVLVTLFIGYGVSKSMNNSNTELSELTLANIEALAQNEGGGNGEETCYNSITSKEGSMVKYCPICDWTDGTDSWYSFSSTCSK